MFSCEKCGKFYATKYSLKRHELIHTGKPPYICKHCNQSFTQAGSLKRHALIHTGECPYICKYCKRRFNRLTTLQNHERTHTGDRPYVCNHCGRSYTRFGSLRYHVRTRKYHCIFNSCKQSFCDAKELEKHKRTHAGDILYARKICQKTFTQWSLHQKNIHTILFAQNINAMGYLYKHSKESERRPFCIIPQCNSAENLTLDGYQPLDLTCYEKHLQL